MWFFIFGIYKNKVPQTQNNLSELDDKSYDSYLDEYKRLDKLRDDSEDLWEARTYQLSAGGLSLTFAIFSFLMSKGEKVCFEWPMAVIWSVYTFCILLNYISHRVSICNIEKNIDLLNNDRNRGKAYDEDVLIERYRCGDKLVNYINHFTEYGLIINIIFTVIYSIIIFNRA